MRHSGGTEVTTLLYRLDSLEAEAVAITIAAEEGVASLSEAISAWVQVNLSVQQILANEKSSTLSSPRVMSRLVCLTRQSLSGYCSGARSKYGEEDYQSLSALPLFSKAIARLSVFAADYFGFESLRIEYQGFSGLRAELTSRDVPTAHALNEWWIL